jgi:hypothetical protein
LERIFIDLEALRFCIGSTSFCMEFFSDLHKKSKKFTASKGCNKFLEALILVNNNNC